MSAKSSKKKRVKGRGWKVGLTFVDVGRVGLLAGALALLLLTISSWCGFLRGSKRLE
jgi:hypothetical protein